MIIEVPLNQSKTDLLEIFKKLIESKQQKISKKSKTKFTGTYQLSENSEPKLRKIRDVMKVFCDVYLPNSRPKIPTLLSHVENYYSIKKIKLPHSIDQTTNDLSNVLKNLERWIKKGDQIMTNVSNGIFPGNYN